ncbi:MAG: phage portal protein family protein [Brevinema sp.]
MAPRIQKIKDSASNRMLSFWGHIPNPNRQFFRRMGVSFDQAMRDVSSVAEVEAAMTARKNAVLGNEWHIAGDDFAKDIEDNFKQIGIHSIFNSIFDSIWNGFTVLDIPLVKKSGKTLYGEILSLPCDWFSFDKSSNLVFSREKNSRPVCLETGNPDKEGELVRYFPSYHNPYGESQLSRVFWPATWLRGNMEYWASYISRFGDDSILVHTDLASADKKSELLKAVMDFRSSGGMVVEGSDTFEILKHDKSSSSQLFKDFALICRESISKLILGHGSALDSTPGKLGSETAIELVRADIRAGDKRLIESVMNSLIRHIFLINGYKDSDLPSFQWAAEDEEQRIARDKALYSMGVRFSPSYLQRVYRLEEQDILGENNV